MKLDHLLTPHTRINSKWIEELSVSPETIKIVEEDTGSKISDIACSNSLSDISPQARETKQKIKKCHYIELKKFCTAKEIITNIKRQPTDWENIVTDTSDKGSISEIYKELTNSTSKKPNPMKKWAKNLNRPFSKKDQQMDIRHRER